MRRAGGPRASTCCLLACRRAPAGERRRGRADIRVRGVRACVRARRLSIPAPASARVCMCVRCARGRSWRQAPPDTVSFDRFVTLFFCGCFCSSSAAAASEPPVWVYTCVCIYIYTPGVFALTRPDKRACKAITHTHTHTHTRHRLVGAVRSLSQLWPASLGRTRFKALDSAKWGWLFIFLKFWHWRTLHECQY